jgi:Spy/CpxP family protein refolding chaperone
MWVKASVAAAAGVMSSAMVGCPSVSEETTLQELLDLTGLGSTTIGDVLGAIEGHNGHEALLPFGATLTAEQETQLTALRDQYTAGELTLQQYAEQASSIVGMAGVGRPFGGGHGRMFGTVGFAGGPIAPGGGGNGPLGLELSDEQRAAAQTIFDAMRSDIESLHEAARAEIEGQLTEEQRATLESLKLDHPGPFRAFPPAVGGGRLAEAIGLSEEQSAAIEAILQETHDAAEARRDQAREEFRAILTEEQLANLDEFAASHPLLGAH